MREPQRGKGVALIDRVAERAALAVVRDLAMKFPMQRRVLLDVQVGAAFVDFTGECLEMLDLDRTRHHRGARGGLYLERFADHEMAGHVFT